MKVYVVQDQYDGTLEAVYFNKEVAEKEWPKGCMISEMEVEDEANNPHNLQINKEQVGICKHCEGINGNHAFHCPNNYTL